MKKISKTSLIKVANAMQNDMIDLMLGEGKDAITIKVRKTIPMDDFYTICGMVAHPPFVASSDSKNVYVPSAELFNFKIAMVKAFAVNINLPDNVTEAYTLISSLNLFQKINDALADTDMFGDLCDIAERYSEFHRLSNTGLSAIENAFKGMDLNAEIAKVMPDVTGKLMGTLAPVLN